MTTRLAVGLLIGVTFLFVATLDASAAHTDSRRFMERLFAESGDWTLTERGEYIGSGTSGGSSAGVWDFDGHVKTEWTATGPVEYDPDTGLIRGHNWTMTFTASGHGRERADYKSGGDHDTTTCRVSTTGCGQVDVTGLWNLAMDRQEALVGASGAGSRIDLKFVPTPIFIEGWSCSLTHKHSPTTEPHAYRTTGPLFTLYPAGVIARTTYDTIPAKIAQSLGYHDGTRAWPAAKGSEERMIDIHHLKRAPYTTVRLPFFIADEPLAIPMIQTASHTQPFLQGNDADIGQEELAIGTSTCDLTQIAFDLIGTCTARSELTLSASLSGCEMLRKIQREDIVILNEIIAAYPNAATEQKLASYQDALLSPQLRSMLENERQMQLIGCKQEEQAHDIWKQMDAVSTRIVNDYDRLLAEGELSTRSCADCRPSGVERLLGHVRQRALLGDDVALPPNLANLLTSATAGGDVSKLGPGATKASTHSPVSIHAYGPDGAHVGWDTTAGRAEVGIAGATYEGRPGEAQTITLPGGLWRFDVEEIAEGNYTFEVAWGSGAGAEKESFSFTTNPGRVFRSQYYIDADPDGNVRAAKGRLFHGVAKESPAFATQFGGATTDPAPVTPTVDTNTGTDASVEGSHVPGATGPPTATPALSALTVFGIVAVSALVRTRMRAP